MSHPMLLPALALVTWTFVMWIWMYATRLPAMRSAGIDPAQMKEKKELDALPRKVRQVADNYNHLHEQPVIFYAMVFYCQLAGLGDGTNVALAWTYVGLRVAHSLFQALVNFIPVRFTLFVLGSFALMGIVGRVLLATFG